MKVEKIDPFTRGYLECALWASTDSDDKPLDARFSVNELSEEVVIRADQDCRVFSHMAHGLLIEAEKQGRESSSQGHDFWLTRNGHGAGFWDGDWAEEVGERLTKASEAFGQVDLYLGDDKKIYC